MVGTPLVLASRLGGPGHREGVRVACACVGASGGPAWQKEEAIRRHEDMTKINGYLVYSPAQRDRVSEGRNEEN